jgi:hypothetical protein
MWSGLVFFCNAFWWGPSAGYRKGLKLSQQCRRLTTEDSVTYEERLSRIIRAYGDQIMQSWLFGATGFQLIFMIRFWWFNWVAGPSTFQPLLTNAPLDIMRYLAVQEFASSMIAIAAIGISLALVTCLMDAFKRFVLALGEADAVRVPDGNTMMTGSPVPQGQQMQQPAQYSAYPQQQAFQTIIGSVNAH